MRLVGWELYREPAGQTPGGLQSSSLQSREWVTMDKAEAEGAEEATAAHQAKDVSDLHRAVAEWVESANA